MMTERAQKIMRAYEGEDTYNFPKDGVVAAIREVVNQLQYYNVHPGEDMILDARAVYDLCDELENL